MIYITGDKHADFGDVYKFIDKYKLTCEDTIIVLGDAGINYFNGEKDIPLKIELSKRPVTYFCIHGNHEERPENIKSYKTKMYFDGIVYYEEEYPNILFAKDGEIYNINDKQTLVIGGAYSVDKYYRLLYGYNWYESEQPNEETKNKVLNIIENIKKVDVVLTHTCPYKYIPREMFISGVDQSTVDYSTEEFLDMVEDKLEYKKWYAGHYHTDKNIDKLRIMYNDIIEFK